MDINIKKETRILVVSLIFILLQYYNLNFSIRQTHCYWEAGGNSEICTTPEQQSYMFGLIATIIFCLYIISEFVLYLLSKNFIIVYSLGVKEGKIINEIKVNR